MKILVVSDTHGHDGNLMKVLKKVKPIDYLIHCGDVEGSEEEIQEAAGCPCVFVRGNNDYYTDLPKDQVVTLGGYRVLVLHGHSYGVSWDTKDIVDLALKKKCSIVMYGHTHRPDITMSADNTGVTTINPGSLTYPRQEGRKPSYIIMEIDRFDKVHFRVNYLTRAGKISLW